MNVKLNGRVFPVEEAAQRLAGMGLRIGEFSEALQPPFEIEFPFAVGASDSRREIVIEIRGTYAAISLLQRMVN
jgi:hypothetical protein